MSESSNLSQRVLSLEVAGQTIRDRLKAALANGRIVVDNGGKYRLAQRPPQSFFGKKGIPPGAFGRKCEFLNNFLFQQIYGQTTVPWSCRDCFKVRITTVSLHQLMEVSKISGKFPQAAKSGPDLSGTARRYVTYVYTRGLDEARVVYKKFRSKVDAHVELGPSTQIIIKRGCSNYERNCGPSNLYRFDPQLEEIEEFLHERFKETKPTAPRTVARGFVLINLVRTAFKNGDETYIEFTNGKPLQYPTADKEAPKLASPPEEIVTYPPEET